MTTNERSKVLGAILQVMQAVHAVAKQGKNDFHGYDFARDVDMIAAVRELMLGADLHLRPTAIELQPVQVIGSSVLVTGTWTWEIVHASSGQAITIQTLGSGASKGGDGDKAAYKAMTGSKKYALEQMFLLARRSKDDPELDDPATRPPSDADFRRVSGIIDRIIGAGMPKPEVGKRLGDILAGYGVGRVSDITDTSTLSDVQRELTALLREAKSAPAPASAGGEE